MHALQFNKYSLGEIVLRFWTLGAADLPDFRKSAHAQIKQWKFPGVYVAT